MGNFVNCEAEFVLAQDQPEFLLKNFRGNKVVYLGSLIEKKH